MGDWIKHDGGACPVDGDTIVEVRFKDGFKGMPTPAAYLGWTDSIIAYRVIEPKAQAHMMSAPPNVHDLCLLENCLAHPQLHIAQDAGFPREIEYMPPPDLRAELDAKDDELAKWKDRALTAERRLRGITFTTNDQGDLVLISEQDSEGRIVRVMWEREEQLRKASDEANTSAPIPGPKTMVGSGALVAVADALDPRLGIAQPEGGPCEPRPTRARWRAMV